MTVATAEQAFRVEMARLMSTVVEDSTRTAVQLGALIDALDKGEAWQSLSEQYAQSEWQLPQRDERGDLEPRWVSAELKASLAFVERVLRVAELAAVAIREAQHG